MAHRETPQHWQNALRAAGFHYVNEVAKAAGLSAPTLGRIIHGETRAPEEKTMFRLAKVLNLTPQEFYKLAGYRAPEGEEWEPVSESAYLTVEERRALDELIKAMVRDRKDQSPHWRDDNVIPFSPKDHDLAADSPRHPSEGQARADLFDNLGEESQD